MYDQYTIERWLGEIGLGRYTAKFIEQNIDFAELRDLTDQDLSELGVSIGYRKRLRRAIDHLCSRAEPSSPETGLSQPASLHEAERRQITALFADLVDYTSWSAQLDLEDIREIIRAYQAACAHEIDNFGGYAARYVGDGILAYFGYPTSRENDTERCVRAGLGIVAAMRDLNEQIASGHGIHLKVRIGIATGTVVVGDLISDVGGTLNLAARLQTIADADTVVVSHSTRELLGNLFEFRSLGKRALKGIEQPVEAWHVRGVSSPESRFIATQVRQLTELVGRRAQMQLLTQRWEQVVDGNHTVILVSGEPGVGKSRLVQEIRHHIEREPHIRLIAQCWPHAENSAWYPVIEMIQRMLQINLHDGVEAKLDKLECALRDSGLSESKLAPLVAALLGIDASERYAPLRLSPDAQKRETFIALADILSALSGQQPTLVVVEDLHWIDPSTREFIAFLLSRMENERIMFLATVRTGHDDRWPQGMETERIELQPITSADTRTMIRCIAGKVTLPDLLVEHIVDRADGVPLYIEELTRLVLSGADKARNMGTETIPSSLQDLLLARLDNLTWERDVAMLGAVIGRRFDHSLIDAVWQGKPSALVRGLDRLVQVGILSQRRSRTDNTYTFRHMLIREAAYAALLRTDRRSMHNAIADVLEQRYAAGTCRRPELLADHFENAGRIDKAVDYLLNAGRQCSGRSANQEAVVHLNRALELLTHLPEGEDRLQRELSLLVAVSSPVVRTRGYASAEAERVLVRARELCATLGDSPQLVAVLCGLSIFSQARGDLTQARELAEKARRLSESANENTLCLLSYRSLGGAAFWQGDLQVARKYLERGVKIYDSVEHSALAYVYFVDPGVVCLSTLALVLWTLGFPEQAISRALESVRVAEATNHPYSVGFAKLYLATVHQFRLEPGPVRDTARDVVALSEAQAFPQGISWGRVLLGWALSRLGDRDEGMEIMLQGIRQWKRTGTRLVLPYFLALLVDVYLAGEQSAEGLRTVAEAVSLANATGELCWLPELYRLRGEYRLRGFSHEAGTRALSRAESDFRLALSESQKRQAKALELRAAHSLMHCVRELGQYKEDEGMLRDRVSRPQPAAQA